MALRSKVAVYDDIQFSENCDDRVSFKIIVNYSDTSDEYLSMDKPEIIDTYLGNECGVDLVELAGGYDAVVDKAFKD